MLARAVPGISLSLPLFILFAKIGIIDTSFGVILVYVAMNVPFTIWFARDFGMRMFLQNFGYFLKLNIKSTGGICAEVIRIIKRISCGQPKYW